MFPVRLPADVRLQSRQFFLFESALLFTKPAKAKTSKLTKRGGSADEVSPSPTYEIRRTVEGTSFKSGLVWSGLDHAVVSQHPNLGVHVCHLWLAAKMARQMLLLASAFTSTTTTPLCPSSSLCHQP